MNNDTTDTLKYQARNYIDKSIIPQIEKDLKVMVYVLIGDKKLEISHSPEGFDTYPSCKDWLKDYCPCKRRKYQARLPEHALCWYGDSRIELYCKIIASIAGTKVYMPFSSIPRTVIHKEMDSDVE